MIANKKTVAILIVVLLLLSLGVYFALMYNPQSETEVETESEKQEYITVFERDKEALSKISVKLQNESFVFEKDENGSFIANGNKDILLRSSSLALLANEVCSISAQKEIEKNVSDLSKYSLDMPESVVNLTFGNEEIEFKTGGKTTDGTQFFMINNDVYLISSSKASSFSNPLSYYRDKNILTVDTTLLSYISYKNNGDEIILKKNTEKDEWNILAPITQVADFGSVNEKILSQIGNLKINKFVDDNPENYPAYGIGENYLCIEDSNGKRQKIYIGAKKDGEYFIRLENSAPIYSCLLDAISFTELGAVDYTNKFVALVNIKDIKNVEIYDYTANKSYNLEPYITDEKETYKIDGKEVVKEKFTDAYQKVIGIMFTGFNDGTKMYEKQYTIKYNMLDESVKTVDFYTFEDRKHVALVNNKKAYTVLTGYLTDMIAALNKASQ